MKTIRKTGDIAEVPEQPGVDPRVHRTVLATDSTGQQRRWHLLDNQTLLAENGQTPVGTLLCVHGNPTSSFLYRSLMEPLASAELPWRVIAVDQLEMGWSERTERRRTLQDRITDLSLLTDTLSLRGKVITVGHDWGGLVSLGWALDNRHQLAGVILTNTGVYQEIFEHLPGALRLATSPGVLPTSTSLTDGFLRTTLALSKPPLPHEVRDAYLAPYRTRARRRGIEQFVADIPFEPGHPSRPTLERVADGIRDLDVPALFVWGPRDVVFSDRYLRDLIARMPQADVHRVEDASHLVWEDADVAAIVCRWLSDTFDSNAQRRPAPPTIADAAQPAPFIQLGQRIEDLAADPSYRDRGAVVEMRSEADGGGSRTISWDLLARRVRDIAAGMLAFGVHPGDRVNVLVPPGADLTATMYACLRIGAVAVVADAGLGVQGLTRAVVGSHSQYVIGVEKALAGARALGWPGQRISVKTLPTIDRIALGVETSLAQLADEGSQLLAMSPDVLGDWPEPDADAAVLFTSGSTGPAKGVVYTHRQLAAMFSALGEATGLGPELGLVAGFAPFALLGPAVGAPSVVPDMDVTSPATLTASALAHAIDRLGEPAVFTSPAALANVLATEAELDDRERAALARVKVFLSAGAPIPADLLRQLRALMPDADLLTPYGMTECLVVTTIDLPGIEDAGQGNGVCVGRPARRVDVAIAPMDELGRTGSEPTTEPGVTGEVLIRAPHARDRYLMLWDTTRTAHRFPTWHATGDVGHLDETGRLWIEGRAAHVIATADGLRTPVALEAAAESVPGVRRAGACAVGPNGTRQIVLVVETDEEYRPGRARRPRTAPAPLTEAVRHAVRKMTGSDVAAVFTTVTLPTDIRHNSKIDRAALSRWAEAALRGLPVGRP
ncbi:alpha/beta fold hydrolase [Devriesea agamarum]|uniref:alpha/beta fold hydrolase n=1 Tax=Devriesea agamarum TaxID=472569 RepID=UPI00071CA4BC|nr:alpha/beta fold hydrolase [Devriesea agamarum]